MVIKIPHLHWEPNVRIYGHLLAQFDQQEVYNLKVFTQKAIALFGCLCACLFIQLSEDHNLLKLGDFGLARATEGTRQTKTLIGSYRYMAPEVMIPGGHYSKKADVYSFGELNKVFSVRVLMVPDGSSCFKISFLHHFHHLHLIYPQKFCIVIVLDFSQDCCNTHEKMETMVTQN